jgi:putative molybdopterin biosynthesis protein
LDYELKKAGIQTEQINGYLNEEYTHLGVAAAVHSGRVNCGLGIAAAAKALDLDFIPLFNETYELVIPEEHYQSKLFGPVLQAAGSQLFKSKIHSLPGYETSKMGEIRIIQA